MLKKHELSSEFALVEALLLIQSCSVKDAHRRLVKCLKTTKPTHLLILLKIYIEFKADEHEKSEKSMTTALTKQCSIFREKTFV